MNCKQQKGGLIYIYLDYFLASSITYILPHERGELVQLSAKVAQLAAVSVEDLRQIQLRIKATIAPHGTYLMYAQRASVRRATPMTRLQKLANV